MSSIEISTKLNQLLRTHEPLTEECHVVYVMVELRKFLDHNQIDLPLLRFYADWTVHTSKDQSLAHIKPIADAMYAAIVAHLTAEKDKEPQTLKAVASFVSMDALRHEIGSLLHKYGFHTSIVDNSGLWGEFVRLLTRVLVDQPITNPCGKDKNVSEIRFVSSKAGCQLTFRTPVGGEMHYHYLA